MALSIMAITRVRPAPCQHFLVTMDEDGVSRTVLLHREDMARLFQDAEHGPKATLVLAWLRYKLAQGATLPSLIGQVIA